MNARRTHHKHPPSGRASRLLPNQSLAGESLAGESLAGESLAGELITSQSTDDQLVWARRILLVLAFSATGVLVYGSLVPFDFHPRGWQEIEARFAGQPSVFWLYAGWVSPTDILANVLLGVPLGFFWLGVVWMGARTWSSGQASLGFNGVLVAIALALALVLPQTIAVELAQHWFGQRTPTAADVLAQALGAVIGSLCWLKFGLGALEVTLRPHPRQAAQWLFLAYCVALLVGLLVPFDLTLSPAELYQKYKKGLVVIIPFSEPLDGPVRLVFSAVAYLPVGLGVALIRPPRGQATRRVVDCVLIGGVIVCAFQGAALLVESRLSSTTAVLGGMAGITVGAWLGQLWGSSCVPADSSHT